MKYWWMFSSPESTVPHGVTPPEQLFWVPSTRLPVGSSCVLSRSEPAAGPSTTNGVVRVMRRLRAPPRTYVQGSPTLVRVISTTAMPWAWMAVLTMLVRLVFSYPVGNMVFSLVYSWLFTNTPVRPFGSGMMSR